MSPTVDPAILHALSLEPSTTKITSHGGSGFASAFQLTTSTDPAQSFFIKISAGAAAAVMFEGEHASLTAIHTAVPSLCPQSLAWGKLRDQRDSYFLATEFIRLSGTGSGGRRSTNNNSSGRGSGMSLAQKLARLHTAPAPIPAGYSEPQFGFPVPTCCGDTCQPNAPFAASWADFFARNRLLAILQRGESRNGADAELHHLVDTTASKVVPRLLGPDHLGGSRGIIPVVVHGDLWSGNHGTGVFVGRRRDQSASGSNDNDNDGDSAPEEVVYDPSSTYAHSEYELGIMNMFGGAGADFFNEYHDLVPRTEPVEEYGDRIKLYELYHHLNHWAIFGGGYRSGAVDLLKMLVGRYGAGGR